MSQKLHSDGIYFGLDEDEYHADPALGSSAIKSIAMDPVDFQYERLQGSDEETDAMIWGRALHSRILEGKASFHSKFVGALVKPEGALVTVDDLSSWLQSRGLSTKGNKPALIERINEACETGLPDTPVIWDVLKAEFAAENDGKWELTAKQFEKIETAANWMQSDPVLAPSMQDGSFQYGAPEVSIFYTDGGVRLKARFDYWLGHAIVDLKSFATMFKEHPSKAVNRAIMRERYDIQCADYVRAWHRGRGLFKAGQVFGDVPEGLLEKVYSHKDPLWVWVFLKSVKAPQPFVKSLDKKERIFDDAQSTVEQAIETYRKNVAEFGEDKIWPPNNPPEAISSDDFPSWFGN